MSSHQESGKQQQVSSNAMPILLPLVLQVISRLHFRIRVVLMLSTTDHAITQVTKAQTPCMYSWSFKLSALTRHLAAYYAETYKRRPLAPRLRASIMFNQSEHRAPPTSKPKSPLPHLWQAETESFLQSSDTEESFISTHQTGPSNFTRKKRAPLTLQLATRDCLSLLARERDPVGRENISSRRQGGAPPNLQAEKSGPPPSV